MEVACILAASSCPRAGGAGAVILLAPQAALGAAKSRELLRGGRFSQGVLSGDPTPKGITLATIVDDVEGSGGLRLEVARDQHFKHVVARRVIGTNASRNHSVKARVNGLRSGEDYFYRFETRNKHSRVGRFRTAVPAELARARALRVLLVRRLHARVLQRLRGDGARGRPGLRGLPRRLHLRRHPAHARRRYGGARRQRREAKTLADYRAKYALYRSDESLRKLHSNFAIVSLWDDHEVLNDYAGSLPDGGLPPAAGYSVARRNAAYRAFFEAMPFVRSGRSPIYRALRFGRHAELILLDERRVPRRPAVRRHDRPRLRRAPGPAAVPRRQAALLGEETPERVERLVEADRQSDADDADEGRADHIRAHGRVDGLPAGARGPDRARGQDLERRVPHGRLPHVPGRRRAAAGER